MLIYAQLVLRTLRRAARGRGDLLLENLALRQQLAMYERRPTICDGDRVFWSLCRSLLGGRLVLSIQFPLLGPGPAPGSHKPKPLVGTRTLLVRHLPATERS